MKFEELGLSDKALKSIKRFGFEKPTEIQAKAIPHIVKGKDVIGESATGSGKTIAFGTAIVEKVIPGKGLQAIILTPTRELAEQVKEVIKNMSIDKKLNVLAVYGGVAINPQIDRLPRTDVVIATPGRLLDHMERGTIDLRKVKVLVLDEADRMLDMGFIDDVAKIISQCPKKERQTLFFSATISRDIDRLALKHMDDSVSVSAVKMVDPKKLKQIYYDVDRNMKLSLLVHLLKKEDSDLVMVFCNTRNTVDYVTKNLKHNGIKAIAIHGGFSQNKRSKTLDLFNDAKIRVMVCTDVAARGLHIDDVSHIYNYDLPRDPKDYVHRIGRTARAGEKGMVINMLSYEDHDFFSRIISEYRKFHIKSVDKPYVEKIETVRVDNDRGRGRGFSDRRGGRSRGRGRDSTRDSGRRGRSSGDRGRSGSRGRSSGEGSRGRSGDSGRNRGPKKEGSGDRGRNFKKGPKKDGPKKDSGRKPEGKGRGPKKEGKTFSKR